MNYRHAYHAGNFADVAKHLALLILLDRLKKKDTPFCVIDAHGGIGLYDLSGKEAQKTGEWKDGAGRLADIPADAPEDIALYTDIIGPALKESRYPGSPRLIAQSLRDGDRLIANELHPEDVLTLKANMRGHGNVRVTQIDAYECIRANIPPKEKRGLVLIDPPFEKTDEFQTLIRQMAEWKKRFAQGVFVIWYPIKRHLEVEDLKLEAGKLDLPRTWCYETLLAPRIRPDALNGSGLIIFNTPWQVPERLEALSPLLKDMLGLYAVETSWLTPA